MSANYVPSELVMKLGAIQRGEIDCSALELQCTIKRCKELLDSSPKTLVLCADLVPSDFYEHIKASAAENSKRMKAFICWAEKMLAERDAAQPKAYTYIVTDLDTENITEISLSKKPSIDHWVVVCRGKRFEGETRDAAENKMLNATTSQTEYRSLTQIAKHIGYEVYTCDTEGRNFPMSGMRQGPFLYPNDNVQVDEVTENDAVQARP